MCDNVQKLVPNHAVFEYAQGTRCYQCDNCGTNNIDCKDNLTNHRYRKYDQIYLCYLFTWKDNWEFWTTGCVFYKIKSIIFYCLKE